MMWMGYESKDGDLAEVFQTAQEQKTRALKKKRLLETFVFLNSQNLFLCL